MKAVTSGAWRGELGVVRGGWSNRQLLLLLVLCSKGFVLYDGLFFCGWHKKHTELVVMTLFRYV